MTELALTLDLIKWIVTIAAIGSLIIIADAVIDRHNS